MASRTIDSLNAAVISVTQFHAGDAWNVIPERAVLRGTTRALRPQVQDTVEAAVHRIAEGIAAAHRVGAQVRYERRYPPTINHRAETERAASVALMVAGEGNIDRDPVPSMGSEDFAFVLLKKPGCYVWIGNGPGEGGCGLHNPRYDFNDAILLLGASYWAKLVKSVLP